MRWNLRFQVLVPLLLLLAGVVAMSAWTAIASANYAWEEVNAQVRSTVRTIEGASFPLTNRVFQLLKGFSGADFLLVESDGRVFGTLPETVVDNLAAAQHQQAEAVRLDHAVSIGEVRYMYASVVLPRGRHAGGSLYIFYPEAKRRQAMWEAVRPTLLVGGLAGFGSVAVAFIVAHRLAVRVKNLEEQTRQIADGDFSPMPLPPQDDELRDLAESVNRLAVRLAEYRASVQDSERRKLWGQFSGGLAHQLRNGVAGARLAVQLHRRHCPAEDNESLEVALRQLTLVETHLRQFLALQDNRQSARRECSLKNIVEEHLALLKPRCEHAAVKVEVQFDSNDAYQILADPEQLGHLVMNLLTNAIEAAGSGGSVHVKLYHEESAVRLIVADTGPGPPLEMGDRIFDPFVTSKPEGIGLGLAVARAVVESHGGKLAYHRRNGMTEFDVHLPTKSQCHRTS